jgi:hypothetical protein
MPRGMLRPRSTSVSAGSVLKIRTDTLTEFALTRDEPNLSNPAADQLRFVRVRPLSNT